MTAISRYQFVIKIALTIKSSFGKLSTGAKKRQKREEMKREKVESVFIEGRSWRDKYYGNSYWSARIWANGRVIGCLPMAYGYEHQFVHESLKALSVIGWITEDDNPVIYQSNTYGLKREMFKAQDFEVRPWVEAVA